MLRQLLLSLMAPPDVRLNMSVSSVLHGAWMEILSPEYAGHLHEQGLRPYSQSVVFDGEGNALWRIGSLTDEVYERAILPLLSQEELFLRQKGYAIGLRLRKERVSSYEELADGCFRGAELVRRSNLRFLTATSFRRDGQYMIWPEATQLFGNLLRRWNAFSPAVKLEEARLEETLAEICSWSRYRLYSRTFSLEGKWITGFGGELTLRFQGTEMARRIIALLLSFAPFSGVGIKTALGMGAVETTIYLAHSQND